MEPFLTHYLPMLIERVDSLFLKQSLDQKKARLIGSTLYFAVFTYQNILRRELFIFLLARKLLFSYQNVFIFN